jgi:hypothetical protein
MNSEHENKRRLGKFVIEIPNMVFTLTTYLKFNKYVIVFLSNEQTRKLQPRHVSASMDKPIKEIKLYFKINF